MNFTSRFYYLNIVNQTLDEIYIGQFEYLIIENHYLKVILPVLIKQKHKRFKMNCWCSTAVLQAAAIC